MSDATQILNAIERGDPQAADQLLPLVYNELRKLAAQKLAREAPGQTLQATALVHEAYVRLLGNSPSELKPGQPWDNRRHFFAAAAEAMRRIILDHARDKNRLKRGGGWRRLHLNPMDLPINEVPAEILALDAALEKLEREDAPCANLVKLRFFAGLTLQEAASTMGIPRRSADRCWAFARSWLFHELRQGDENPES